MIKMFIQKIIKYSELNKISQFRIGNMIKIFLQLKGKENNDSKEDLSFD